MNRLVELRRRDRSRRSTLPWTDARIAHLKARWSQGVTAQRIARELGGGISRSAVLGKIHRLGFAELSPRAWVSRSHLKRGGGRRISQQLRGERLLGGIFAAQHWLPPAWVIEAKPYVDDPRVDANIPLAQRRSLLELTAGACRWPVGDPSHPDFFFCGAEALRGELYCATHRARAYRPAAETIPGAPSPRRRRTVRRDHGPRYGHRSRPKDSR